MHTAFRVRWGPPEGQGRNEQEATRVVSTSKEADLNRKPLLHLFSESLQSDAAAAAAAAAREHREGRENSALLTARRSCWVPTAFKLYVQWKLRSLGLVFFVAPYEADAQIARLVLDGLAAAALTEDSDLLAYGCNKVLSKLQHDGGMILSDLQELLSCLSRSSGRAWTLEALQVACCLSGCDYHSQGVAGVGFTKAERLLERHGPDVEAIFNALKACGRPVTAETPEKVKVALLTFRHQTVFSIRGKGEIKAVPLTPPPVPLDGPSQQMLGPLLPDPVAAGVCGGFLHPVRLSPLSLFSPSSKDQASSVQRASNSAETIKPWPAAAAREGAQSYEMKSGSLDKPLKFARRFPLTREGLRLRTSKKAAGEMGGGNEPYQSPLLLKPAGWITRRVTSKTQQVERSLTSSILKTKGIMSEGLASNRTMKGDTSIDLLREMRANESRCMQRKRRQAPSMNEGVNPFHTSRVAVFSSPQTGQSLCLDRGLQEDSLCKEGMYLESEGKSEAPLPSMQAPKKHRGGGAAACSVGGGSISGAARHALFSTGIEIKGEENEEAEVKTKRRQQGDQEEDENTVEYLHAQLSSGSHSPSALKEKERKPLRAVCHGSDASLPHLFLNGEQVTGH
ncbi:hypothetical protein Emag_002080 [Eimeria magna]